MHTVRPDPLRDMQRVAPAGWCLRCRGELYGEEKKVCAQCRKELNGWQSRKKER